MFETPTPPPEPNEIPPLTAEDYRAILRSHYGRLVFALFVAAFACWVSVQGYIPFGLIPTGLIGFGFGYGIGGKFFPDSDALFRIRARNYRRAKKGLRQLGEEEVPEIAYHDDFRKG